MKQGIIIGIGATIVGAAFFACSSQGNPTGNFFKNLTAANCQDPQAIVQNIPAGVLTPAQQLQLANLACKAFFGTVSAPTPAPGNSPVVQ